ncbi:ABC transporter permease [Natronorubrum thiooxidans]|uniref:Osmoprotectant transport system permease protein n=1 Tax=Natronorubrum thiooxidans TaxID=308853 RepID=A0A1N7H3V1_9EURY|nr:ABC transporter permease [Natronorubrum thiooxidans]SIS19524.1 osmoprotectant transport system permease protein [Natronorubrum thiooxidans]
MTSPTPVPGQLASYWEFILENFSQLVVATLEHAEIITISIALAVPIGVGLGVLITFDERLATVVIWLAGVMMTIPSIAMFGLLIPFVGIGAEPVIVALVLYSQLPVIRNTYVGLTDIDPAALEAGRAMGMTRVQLLRKVQIPKALPVIMAGVRNSVVILIGIAAIGAFIGAGGLGTFIFDGIARANVPMIVVATIILSVLALAFDYAFKVSEQVFRLKNGEQIEPSRLTRLIQRVRA